MTRKRADTTYWRCHAAPRPAPDMSINLTPQTPIPKTPHPHLQIRATGDLVPFQHALPRCSLIAGTRAGCHTSPAADARHGLAVWGGLWDSPIRLPKPCALLPPPSLTCALQLLQRLELLIDMTHTYTHTHIHTRTHARAHAHAYTRAHTHATPAPAHAHSCRGWSFSSRRGGQSTWASSARACPTCCTCASLTSLTRCWRLRASERARKKESESVRDRETEREGRGDGAGVGWVGERERGEKER
jgi:hypothetical protein